MENNEFEKWNESMVERYNPDCFITKTGLPIRLMEAWRLRLTAKASNTFHPKRVLDIGCGAGNLIPFLHGQEKVGVDLSSSLLKIAEERLKTEAGVQLIKGNIEKMDFLNPPFDVVICSEALEHVLDPENVIKEMHRLLKTDGHAVVTVPNEILINKSKKWILKMGLKKLVAGQYPMSDNMLHEWHRLAFSKEDLLTLCDGQFNLVKIINVPFSFVPFHQIYVFHKKNP